MNKTVYVVIDKNDNVLHCHLVKKPYIVSWGGKVEVWSEHYELVPIKSVFAEEVEARREVVMPEEKLPF